MLSKDPTLAAVYRTAKRGPRSAKWISGLGEVMTPVVR